MKKATWLLLLVLVLGACAPSPEELARAEVIKASAEATRTATEYQSKQNEIALQVRATVTAQEVTARQAELEQQRQIALARGEAEARTVTTLGYALAAVLVAFALAAVIVSVGFAAASVRRAVIESAFVKIGVERLTLQAPPMVIVNGFLIDTTTGERARLSDGAGVNRLKLAASAQATNTAILARAAAEIAGKAGDADPARSLPGIAASVPLIESSAALAPIDAQADRG